MEKRKFSSVKKKQIFITAVTLLEIFVLLVVATYSWLPDQTKSQINSTTNFSVSADAGLRINFGDDYSGEIKIEDFVLQESSSIDGRNMYFPTTGTLNKNITSQMKFRQGNASDINSKYIMKTFTMRADSGATDVWLSADTYVKWSGTADAASPIRVAFYENNGKDPIVFSPELMVDQPAKQCNAIHSVNDQGTATTGIQQSYSFSDYLYANTQGNVLFSLESNEVKKITLIIWLEGTDPDCTYANAGSKGLDLNIRFSSTWEETETFRFIDDTPAKWVNNDSAKVMMVDLDTGKGYLMEKQTPDDYTSDYTWICRAPVTIENAVFYRVHPTTYVRWNNWTTTPARNGSYTYVANGTVDQIGYWRYNPEDMGSGNPTQPSQETTEPSTSGTTPTETNPVSAYDTIYFDDAFDWVGRYSGKLYVYYWGQDGSKYPCQFPGHEMTLVGEVNGVNRYKFDLQKNMGIQEVQIVTGYNNEQGINISPSAIVNNTVYTPVADYIRTYTSAEAE